MSSIASNLVPQAPDLTRIRALLLQISLGVVARDDLVNLTGIRHRHINYVKNAARCLGWLDEGSDSPTQAGRDLLATLPGSVSEGLHIRESIVNSKVLTRLCPDLLAKDGPTREELTRRIQKLTGLGGETADIRANTLVRWRATLVKRGLVGVSPPDRQLDLVDPTPPPAPTFVPFDATSDAFLDLRQRIAKSPKDVVFLTGAGVSKFSGLPLWSELRDQLVKQVRQDALTLADDEKSAVEALAKSVANYSDLWQAFPRIRTSLGGIRYVQAIRRLLSTENCPSNQVYDLIWRFGVHGIITYNLDRLPLDSYAQIRRRSLDYATHKEPAKYNYFLQKQDEFLLLAHGDLADETSWVFTKEERDQTLNSTGLRDFIASVLRTKVVVLVGFNPLDVTFEFHAIETLRRLHSAPRLFIITHTKDSQTLEQYRDWGLRVVQYNQRTTSDHTALLDLLKDIATYAPDSGAPPSAFQGGLLDPANLLPDEQLASLHEEDIRSQLNAAVAFLVRDSPSQEGAQLDALRDLFSKYPRSTHKAWLFEPGHPALGRLFGRLVEAPIGKGAFGQVYRVSDPDSGVQAAKVMLEEVRRDPRYVLSFRRGIKSMKILAKHNIDGMVRFHDAYEVPPTIFMEHVPGLTLEEALSKGYLSTLEQRLHVLTRVAAIVASAHELEDVVLHRDIKPANVMLRNPIFGADSFEVVVLDFDLSWHRGANERSVAHSARMQGYAAPEQSSSGSDAALTRNAAVDSFGMGMLIFFVLMERHPYPGEQQFPNFQDAIAKAAVQLVHKSWRAIPLAVSRLVYACTRSEQGARPSMPDIVRSLTSLSRLLVDDVVDVGDPLLLQELLARLFPDRLSELQNTDFGRIWTHPGPPLELRLALSASRAGDPEVNVSITRMRLEHDKRSTFEKYLDSKVDRAVKALKPVAEGTRVTKVRGGAEIAFSLTNKTYSHSKIRELVQAIDACRSCLTEF